MSGPIQSIWPTITPSAITRGSKTGCCNLSAQSTNSTPQSNGVRGPAECSATIIATPLDWLPSLFLDNTGWRNHRWGRRTASQLLSRADVAAMFQQPPSTAIEITLQLLEHARDGALRP